MTSAPRWQIERLQEWLAEWQTDRLLADACDDWNAPLAQGHGAVGELAPEVAPYDSTVREGEVRLLSPTLPGARERPRYVLVLSGGESGDFEVCPFSRFETPAVPGELLTGLTSPFLQVLCLWCCREMASADLAQSWRVAGLSEEERELYRRAREHLEREGRLPDDLADRGGAPLVHPLDPRHDYIDEQALWNEAPSVVTDGSLVYPAPDSGEFPLAAEDRDDYAPD